MSQVRDTHRDQSNVNDRREYIVTQRRADLDAQIDALLTDVQKPPAQPAPPPPEGSPAQSPTRSSDTAADHDITGMALADEIQEMLDEASARQAGEAPAAPDPIDAEPVDPDAAAEQMEKDLVSQIDQMLSEQADKVLESDDVMAGGFQTIDDVLGDESTEPAATGTVSEDQPQPAMAATDTRAAVEDAGDEIAGDIETLESVLADDGAGRPRTTDEDAKADPPRTHQHLTLGAAAVAAELDADEMAGARVVDDQPDEPSNAAPDQAETDGPAKPADPAMPIAARQRIEAIVNLLVRLLEPMNRPFARFSPRLRDTLGWIGLTNALGAAALLFYALFIK